MKDTTQQIIKEKNIHTCEKQNCKDEYCMYKNGASFKVVRYIYNKKLI